MKKIIYILIAVFAFVFNVKAQTELVSTGTGSAYVIAYPAAFSYSAGISVTFKAHSASTAGPITLNINGLGAKTIKKNVTTDLALGDIKLNQYVTVMYDGTNFQLTSAIPYGAAGWGLGGNAVAVINSLGTTSNFDLPFITNNTERLRITNTGDFGIGTNAPEYKVDINNSVNNIVNIRSSASALYTMAGVRMSMYDTYNGTSYNLYSEKNDATANSGSSDFVIRKDFSTVGGYLKFLRFDNSTSDVIVNDSKTAASAFGNFIVANGNVGIGTSTPQQKIHTLNGNNINELLVESHLTSALAGSQINLAHSYGVPSATSNTFAGDVIGKVMFSGYNTANYAVGAEIRGSGDGLPWSTTAQGTRLDFFTTPATSITLQNRMTILNTGNVGIGTATPTAKLHIGGTSGVDGIRFPDGTLQTTAAIAGPWTKSGTTVYPTTLTDNVGIGTSSPTTKLDVRDGNKVTSSNAPGNLNVMTTDPQAIDIGGSISLGGYYDNTATTTRVFGTIEGRKITAANNSSSGYLAFKTNNGGTLAEKMRIDNIGNVGIGTTSPAAKLDVAGTVRIADGTEGAGKILTSDATGNASWQDAPAKTSSFRVGANNQTLAGFTSTIVDWNSTVFNDGSDFTLATDRYTAPSTGLYYFETGIYFPTYNGRCHTEFIVNGGSPSGQAFGNANGQYTNRTSTLIKLNAGDYVQVRVYNIIGASTIGNSSLDTWFAGYKIY